MRNGTDLQIGSLRDDNTVVFSTKPLIEGGICNMKHFLKGLFLRLKIERLVNNVIENSDNNEDLIKLNFDMMDIEKMYSRYYNEVLLTPFYSRSAKKEVLDELIELTNVMNEYRFRNHCIA